MATRASISVISPTSGEIKSIYLHFDGYKSHAGKILVENYNTYEKAMELLSYGDMSELREDIEKSVFYNRDFRESENRTRATTIHTLSLIDWEQYNYLFEEGEWLVLTPHKTGLTKQRLADLL